MSNPTSNFGWQMPTPTDLVTDLPADFEVFGQAVDSSMADLKGGTSGQILSKATNTDMDFVWTDMNPGDITGVTAGTGISGGGTSGTVTITNSMATEITAKGDLIVGTGSATFDNLAAGSNGQTLVADSSTTTGLRYQGSMAAGKNTIINGGMDIWQRGTASQTPSNGAQLNVDRFYFTGGAGVVFTQDTDVPTSPYFQYSLKTVDAANYGFSMGQKIEAANSVLYAGQTVTVSFWAKTTSGTATMIVNAYYPSAKDNFTTLTLIASNSMTTPTATWTRFSTQFTLPSNVQNGLMILIGRGATTNTSFYTGVQLELGSVATSFQRAGGTIQGELAACQRYYQVVGGVSGQPIVQSYTAASAFNQTPQNFPVQMRVAPTATKSGTWAVGNCGQPSASNLTVYGYALQTQKDGNLGTFYFYPDSSDDTITFSAEL
jgi:hypothetical protein